MRGYVLPVVLALLLAAPMLWRLDSGVSPGGDARTARVVFEEPVPMEPLPETLAVSDGRAQLSVEPADFAAAERSGDVVQVMPATALIEAQPGDTGAPIQGMLPQAAEQD